MSAFLDFDSLEPHISFSDALHAVGVPKMCMGDYFIRLL